MKYILTQIYVALVFFLFAYTASSKFFDMHKFVFQMSLAPLPLMKTLAPTLGWLVPSIEILICLAIVGGIYYYRYQMLALYTTVVLMTTFAVYIGLMLLTHSKLPCTCGGIISSLGWGEHLLLNAFFIIAGILSISYLKKNQTLPPTEPIKPTRDDYKILSRA
jgi:putative oxidoreductase